MNNIDDNITSDVVYRNIRHKLSLIVYIKRLITIRKINFAKIIFNLCCLYKKTNRYTVPNFQYEKLR